MRLKAIALTPKHPLKLLRLNKKSAEASGALSLRRRAILRTNRNF